MVFRSTARMAESAGSRRSYTWSAGAVLWPVLLMTWIPSGAGEKFTLVGDTQQTVQCLLDTVIVPVSVFYGASSQGSSCVNEKAWFRVADLCFKKPSCILSVSGMIDTLNQMYWDPCPGENKKLEVQYSCVRANRVIEMCSVAANTQYTVIEGEPVAIYSPNYPSYYPASKTPAECKVSLLPPTNRRDLTTQIAFMDMENNVGGQGGCIDKLTLADPSNAAKTYDYCGNSPTFSGQPTVVTAESVVLSMTTDSTTARMGFVVVVNDAAWGTCTNTVNKCINNAECTMSASGTSTYCKCPQGYSGNLCQTVTSNPCQPNPCKHDGACSSSGTSYTCTCASGWTGLTCNTAVVPGSCSPNPCANSGMCSSTGSAFTCACAAGYTGTTCTTPTSTSFLCASNSQCRNGGTCVKTQTASHCNCVAGFSGDKCQNYVGANGQYDDCSPNPCKNNAQCIDDIQDYKCVCNAGYAGKDCAAAAVTGSAGFTAPSILQITFSLWLCFLYEF